MQQSTANFAMDDYPRLCDKYNIPLEYLTYEHVEDIKKENVKELEKIIKILRSKEEGNFPDLLHKAEQKLALLNPNSLLLRFAKPTFHPANLNPEVWDFLKNDLTDWSEKFGKLDKELGRCPVDNIAHLPPIRCNSDHLVTKRQEIAVKESDFDADKEIKIALEGTLTIPEKLFLAEKEKNQGNELFKSGEINEAVCCYTKSIAISPNIAAYNNRAMAYLKLKKYNECINDCTTVLLEDSSNVKALYRCGVAHIRLDNISEASKCFNKVLEIEPGNKQTQIELNRLQASNCMPVADECLEEKPIRIYIEEIDSGEVDDGDRSNTLELSEAVNSTYAEKQVIEGKQNLIVQELESTGSEIDDSIEAISATSQNDLMNQINFIENNSNMLPHHIHGSKLRKEEKAISPFQFLNKWHNLEKYKIADCTELLLSVEPGKLPKMIGSEIDGNKLCIFLRAIQFILRKGLADEKKQAAELFNTLPQVPRFFVVLIFLTREEKNVGLEIINQMELDLIEVNTTLKEAFK